MAFKIPTAIEGKKLFFVFDSKVYKQSLLIHEYRTKTEVHRGMISFLAKHKYSLKKIRYWWSMNHDCVFSLYAQFVYIWKLCSCKKLLFSNNKLICSSVYFCTIFCFSRVGYPEGISHQKSKALWVAVDCKKHLQSILVWLERYQSTWKLSRLVTFKNLSLCLFCLLWKKTILWCLISYLEQRRCRIITPTF